MAVCGNQNVFRLEVAIDNSHGMKVSECECEFCDVNANLGDVEAFFLSKKTIEFAAWDVFESEVEFGGALKGEPEIDNEWVLHFAEN